MIKERNHDEALKAYREEALRKIDERLKSLKSRRKRQELIAAKTVWETGQARDKKGNGKHPSR